MMFILTGLGFLVMFAIYAVIIVGAGMGLLFYGTCVYALIKGISRQVNERTSANRIETDVAIGFEVVVIGVLCLPLWFIFNILAIFLGGAA